MYFNFDMPAFILIRDWAPRRTRELVWSVFGVFIISLGHEGVKRLREMVKKWDKQELEKDEAANRTVDRCPCNDVPVAEDWLSKISLMLFRKLHLISTILMGIQTTLGYLLMLASMTYNVWIFISIVLGTLIGYFMFNVELKKELNKSVQPTYNNGNNES